MPKTCCAVGCSNHNMMLKKLSFHKFPKDTERQKLWVVALKRDNPDRTPWVPTKNAVICSEHFISGKPSSDPLHPDYVPTVFAHSKTMHSEQAFQRYNGKRKPLAESTPNVVDSTPSAKFQKLSPRKLFPDLHNGNEENHPVQIYTATPIVEPQPLPTGLRTPLEQSEREKIYIEMDNLRKAKDELIQQNISLQGCYLAAKLSSALVESNDTKCKFYTGLSWDVFLSTFTFLSQFVQSNKLCRKFSLREQFFMTLVKLRLDFPLDYLADQHELAQSTIHKVFWNWINVMHAKLTFLIHWPDRETIQQTLPGVFKSKFPRLTSIIDCIEIFVDRPKNLKARAKVYSNYKKHSTVKVLISCSPLGSITFLSSAWGGRVSDVELVRASGFIDRKYHHPGDKILADRGFTLQDDFAANCSAELIIPAFTKGKQQLSAQEVEVSRKMSSVRIHIERVIGIMKNRFSILKGPLPIIMIKSLTGEAEDKEFSSIDQILQVCGALTNLGDGVVYSET